MSADELSGKPDQFLGGNLVLDLHPFLKGELILLVTSFEGKRDKLQLDELPGLSKDFT